MSSGRAPVRRAEGVTPLHVLHVINQLGPGGAERSLEDLVGPLADQGVQISIACVRPVAPEYLDDFVPPCPLQSLEGTNLVAKALKLRKRLKSAPPDVVHTTLFEANLVGRLAAAGLGVPVVSSLVNTEYEPVRRRDPNVNSLKLTLVQNLDRWTGRFLTRHFHAITGAVRRSAVRRLGYHPDRITVIPRGRDPRRLGRPSPERRLRVRESLGLAADAEVVLHVGRHEFQKGHEHLLRAASLLAPHRPNLRVLAAGRRGNTSPLLDRLHEDLGLGETVRFLGSRPDVADLLAAADVFAFPSLYEGLGGSVIEAMALGLPVVASDLPALREVVEDGRNAVLVPSANPEALAEAIEQLLDDQECAHRYGVRSREIFLERFTIDTSAQALAELYRRVVA